MTGNRPEELAPSGHWSPEVWMPVTHESPISPRKDHHYVTEALPRVPTRPIMFLCFSPTHHGHKEANRCHHDPFSATEL